MVEGLRRTPVCSSWLRVVVLAVYLTLPSVRAQEGLATQAEQPVSAEVIEAAKKTAEANTDLDPNVRTKVVELYAKALQELKDESLSKSELAKLQAELATAAGALSKTREDLEAPTEALEKPLPSDDLATVQQRLTAFEQKLQQAESDEAGTAQKIASRARLRSEIPGKLEEARKSLIAIAAELNTNRQPMNHRFLLRPGEPSCLRDNVR